MGQIPTTVLTVGARGADESPVSPSVPPPNQPAPVHREPSLEPPAGRARPKLLAAVAVAAVLGGLAFALFGGATSRVVDPVAEAATVSSAAHGYQMHFSIQIASSAGSGPITGTGYGRFDVRDRTGSLSLTMNLGTDPQVIQTLGSNTVNLREILSGTTVYMKLPAFAANALPIAGKQWIAVDLAEITGIPGLSSLESNPVSSDPSQMLQFLRAASDGVVAEGRQQVDGYATTHYRADLSLDRVASALPSAQRALATLEQTMQLRTIPVDVWVDAHHLVRRIEMTMAASVANGSTLDEIMAMDITHYGPQPPPALPPADEVANLSALIGSGG